MLFIFTTIRRWRWWIAAVLGIVALAAGVVYFLLGARPAIPDPLVQKRAEVARLLEESSRIQDVDISSLVVLEREKRYAEAVALIDSALAANSEHERIAGTLIGLSRDLSDLALAVEPDEIGTKAVEAFAILVQLAESEEQFYTARRSVYEETRKYYGTLVANPAAGLSVPPKLETMVSEVNAELEEARALNERFSAAILAFDAAVEARR